VLSSLVSASGGGRVHIVAHSMGTMLTLESLRQLYARYGDTVTSKIGAVVFAAPDIDMDVFSSAIHRIGPLAGKITVIASTNDRALALSGQIAGGMTRVGAAEKAVIAQLGVRVVDARAFAVDAAGFSGPMLLAQCDTAFVCSDVKLALLEDLPPDHEVTVLQGLGLPDERVFTVALADLDPVRVAHAQPLLRHGRDHIAIALDLVLVIEHVALGG